MIFEIFRKPLKQKGYTNKRFLSVNETFQQKSRIFNFKFFRRFSNKCKHFQKLRKIQNFSKNLKIEKK